MYIYAGIYILSNIHTLSSPFCIIYITFVLYSYEHFYSVFFDALINKFVNKFCYTFFNSLLLFY